MPGGLVALLDDVATLAKLAAASVDDVAGAAGRAGAKAAGVVIDDTAVTPRFVTGLPPERELPIIAKIALGSLRNKLVFILPAALALSAFAPRAITPLLMVGGCYLCFEACEKIWEALSGTTHGHEVAAIVDPAELEARQVSGAVRTDFILSAEIMAIALAELPEVSFTTRAGALAGVAVGITVAVYGVVALIVKMDDVGLHLARRSASAVRAFGRGLVRTMPVLLSALSHIGVAAMAWVGGGILLHGVETFGLNTLPGTIDDVAATVSRNAPVAAAFAGWGVSAIGSAIAGLTAGASIVLIVQVLRRLRMRGGRRTWGKGSAGNPGHRGVRP